MKTARAAWRRLEPVHAMIYFVPEGRRRYAELGLNGPAGYFASRSALVASRYEVRVAAAHAAQASQLLLRLS